MLDAEGINIFHLAAQKGWMDRIPARLLTEANLQCICYPNYWTAFYWAAFLGNLNHVPIHLLTPSNLNECDFEGRTIFHWAALYGQLNLLPDECLTRNNLSKPDDIDGSTPLHWAATHGHLNQIPERVKTREDLMLKNWPDASTVYQHAAADGNLHQVPVDLLDAGAILEKDTKGRTVLEYSVEHCQLSLLPISEQLATRIVEVKARLTDARHRLASKKMDMHKQQDILSCTRAWEVELARLALKPRGKELVIGAR